MQRYVEQPYSEARAIDVLLVEDDPDDVYLTREALASTKLRVNLHVAEDGIEAMQFLRREEGFASSVRPNLILLDLNLPRMDGREVLAEVKSDPYLVDIPVVILTTSKAEEDIARSYRQHANCYISKPVDLDKFRTVVNLIEDFWFTVVKLPPSERPVDPREVEAPR
jgi:chemotaxis family two-component system response regulator Rcp1